MPDRREKTYGDILRKAINNKLIDENDTVILFHDLSLVQRRIEEIMNLFPPETIHTVAIKSNPLIKLLMEIKRKGLGAEAASPGELYIAEQSGFPKSKTVFDSPAKTINELKYALEKNIYINADSLDELGRINAFIKSKKSRSKIGIRINPQIGAGKITMTSVAGEYSKFGVPIKEFRNELINCFLNYEWLFGVHLHIGSQGCPVEMLVSGIKIIYDFAEEVNSILHKKGIRRGIKFFDIGGGMPVQYLPYDNLTTMPEYLRLLKKNCPNLFTGKYKLITEFGRWINANAGWKVSRVEYIKPQNGVNTAIIHTGADLFIRKTYSPSDWHLEIFCLNETGSVKKEKHKNNYVIAGPLCFAGDVFERNISLQE